MCPLYRDVRFIEIFLKIVWLQSKIIRSSSYCPFYRGVRFIVCPLYRDSTVQWMLAYLTTYVNTSVNILKIWTVHAEPSGHSDIGHHPRYCNDIADMMSMKHMTMSIYDINLKWSWDWTNQTLMSSWRCLDNGRYPAKKKCFRIVYLFSITENNVTFILLQLKSQSFRRLFSVAATKKIFFSQNSANLLKRYFWYCKLEYLLRKAY